MRYAFLFICCLFLPGVLYGMEMDPEAAEEGRAKSELEASVDRLKGILSTDIMEEVSAQIASLKTQEKKTMLEQMEKIAKEGRTMTAEDTYLIGKLYIMQALNYQIMLSMRKKLIWRIVCFGIPGLLLMSGEIVYELMD